MGTLSKVPVRRGKTDGVTQAPGSPLFERVGPGLIKLTLKFNGTLAACLAAAPNPGDPVAGWAGLTVRQPVRITPQAGGNAELSYVASNEQETAPGGDPESTPVYEIDWTQISKDIESHPLYGVGGDRELDDDERNKLAAWRAASTAAEKAAAYAALAISGQHIAEKIIRGQDSYIIFAPIARVTTRHAGEPTTGRCGVIGAPPEEVQIGGYEYLKTADRATSTGRWWERIQEWTGAEKWDADIYPATFSLAGKKPAKKKAAKKKKS